jgi:hypothetical protein
LNSRIKRLEDLVKEYKLSRKLSVFLLEDGSTFTTDEDPITYLMEHGIETPKGRIVAYPHETKGIDALSLSIYEMIDEGIANGGLQSLFKLVSAE